MRLDEQRILDGLLHRTEGVRELALAYFERSFTDDPRVIGRVIEAIEQYGWDEAFFGYTFLAKLPQTDESLEWARDALADIPDDAEEPSISRKMHLSSLIAKADIDLLLRRKELLDQANLMPEFRQVAERRLASVDADLEEAWKALRAFCEANEDTVYADQISLTDARLLVEAVAREPGRFADRVLEALSLPDDPSDDLFNPWVEGLSVELAGRMRLENAIPRIVEKLHLDADWLSEQCVEALVRIGTDASVEAVAEDFPNADWPFRLYGSGVFEGIHTELTVETMIHLLEAEEDETVRVSLLEALLRQLDDRGIEPARKEVLSRELTPDLTEVRSHLLDASDLMGIDFPEKEQWREASKHDAEFRREWYAKERAMRENVGFHPELGPALGFDEPPAPIREGRKIGRNEPCPCGSGKKYKKCCGAG